MNKIYISIVAALGLLTSCLNNQNSHGHSHDVIGGHAAHDDHAHEAGALSYTLFANNFELFVEFPALSVGQTSSFAAHFTDLSTYKPVSDGKLTVSIVKGDKGIRHSVDAPASPGIFRPSLQPKEAGTYKMLFELVSSTGKVTFEIPQVQVYASADEAAHAIEEEAEGDEISFLKEQAWKTDFATQEVILQAFYSVIHTSAKVGGQPQSSVAVNAQANGQVNLFAIAGQSVKKGELLAVVTASGIENNIDIKMSESKIAYEKSKADYDRAKPLVAKQVVSQKDYLQIESQYKQDSIKYYQLASQVSQDGLKITSPIDGFVDGVHVTNGQFVNNGSVVLKVSNRNKLLIEAFVNQSDFEKVNGIFDANFTYGDKKESITLKQLDGEVASSNAFITEGITRIPVNFTAFNNGQLMPGMYVEAFLKTGKKENALVIPLSAIIEEQGMYYVFVQTGGESFVKRQVEIANNDGILTEVSSGLSVGERIVTQGAYQIKLAAMAGDLPLHGHTH
ncbi:efflux RND transporter periplasmic adaptor subunit [Carboxylicivirga sp. A043]|uniref:efflux RND transporter periplasmic adaptor subunit n=1 Tax=Carboxylicivirga litoralis TaxID=2816963 RepID=UPI0021CAE949|nr:efflux RND transporter periplasmic adaptor subunit [Carboxylicivirga sp. A043]MCU4156126.1 efflux RND transporter periplasmic adaptor subunit [Carboxylicivirga sp. A043]